MLRWSLSQVHDNQESVCPFTAVKSRYKMTALPEIFLSAGLNIGAVLFMNEHMISTLY